MLPAPPDAALFPIPMIVFGCAVTDDEIYRECAEPGIRLAAEPDSEIRPLSTAGSIFRNYNLYFDEYKDRDDIEALVLVHQDAEIVDPDFCAKVRKALQDPDVALVGCAGAIGVRSIAWWEGSVVWASYVHRFREVGGGEIEGMTWAQDKVPTFAQYGGEVESIDGFVIAFTPWAMRNLRFDESLGKLHGYDLDICMQAREAGKKVAVETMRVVHHHSLDLISDQESWINAHMRLAEKWQGRLPHVGEGGGDWQHRARRAEAEASAARMEASAAKVLTHAKLWAVGEELRMTKESLSWRLTKPLRWFSRLFGRGESTD